MIRELWMATGALACLMLIGCATPRVVSDVTSSGDKIKFGYYQGAAQGIVQCTIDAGGNLSGCRDVQLHFQED